MHRSVVAFRQIILWPLSAVLYFRSCNIDFKVQLSPNKTSPQDIMPTPLMKLCKDEMSSVICHLANISFTSGHFSHLIAHWAGDATAEEAWAGRQRLQEL